MGPRKSSAALAVIGCFAAGCFAAGRRWIAPLLLISALAGCTVFAAPPAADPNVGGGRMGEAEQLSPPDSPPGGAPRVPVEDAGGGKADPATFATQSANAPALPGFPSVDLSALRPGEAAQREALTFTLLEVRAGANETVVSWQVSGLPGGYTPSGQEPAMAIQLQNGALLYAVGAQGSVSGAENGAVEAAQVTFPALPAGARSFTLLLPNAWGQKSETWAVPVVMED